MFTRARNVLVSPKQVLLRRAVALVDLVLRPSTAWSTSIESFVLIERIGMKNALLADSSSARRRTCTSPCSRLIWTALSRS
jgi:hypothetical protein